MALETATYVDGLVNTNPASGDSRTTADDHLRLLKAALQRTFPNVDGAVTGTPASLNRTNDLTSSAQDQLDTLKDGKLDSSATAAFAISAGGAQSAVFATSATNATSAVFATSATNAASAVFATSATNATSAVFATSATRATSAVYATSAGDYNGTISAGQIPDASVGGQGVVELATTAEYATATDVGRAASVGVLGRPFSKSTEGYITLPGGVVLQWGTSGSIASNNSAAITFPVAFSTACQNIQLTLIDAGVGDTWDPSYAGASTTGFTLYNHGTGGSSSYDWFAIGY